MGAAIISTIIAWFIGLIIDANLDSGMLGFLGLRMLFPILTMGGFILYNIRKK